MNNKNKIQVFILLIFFIVTGITSAQQEKVMCITVDDLPYITIKFKNIKTGRYITRNILSTFKKYNITALGSVNTNKLYTNDEIDSAKIDILKSWLDSGMMLANHTYAHKNYNKISFREFKYDILDGEFCLKDIMAEKNIPLKYFRHPHLFRGNTKEKADSLQHFLDSLGYIVAPVTIDNSDYIFSLAYETALSKNNDTLAKKIGADYIKYMSDVIDYFEDQSIKLLNYNVKHILLTHANMLNADYFDALIKMYMDKGYKFISIDEALEDKCYKDLKDEFYNNGGISWLHRWAWTMGKRGDFFKGEPEVPEYINELIK